MLNQFRDNPDNPDNKSSTPQYQVNQPMLIQDSQDNPHHKYYTHSKANLDNQFITNQGNKCKGHQAKPLLFKLNPVSLDSFHNLVQPMDRNPNLDSKANHSQNKNHNKFLLFNFYLFLFSL